MNTELDKIMESYQINLVCQRVMKKIIRNNPELIPLQSYLPQRFLRCLWVRKLIILSQK